LTYPIYKKADIILILKTKLSLAKKRVITRFLKRKLLNKKDKKINQSFKKTIGLLKYLQSKEYNKKIKLQSKIAKKHSKKTIILKNKKQINTFLKSLK